LYYSFFANGKNIYIRIIEQRRASIILTQEEDASKV